MIPRPFFEIRATSERCVSGEDPCKNVLRAYQHQNETTFCTYPASAHQDNNVYHPVSQANPIRPPES